MRALGTEQSLRSDQPGGNMWVIQTSEEWAERETQWCVYGEKTKTRLLPRTHQNRMAALFAWAFRKRGILQCSTGHCPFIALELNAGGFRSEPRFQVADNVYPESFAAIISFALPVWGIRHLIALKRLVLSSWGHKRHSPFERTLQKALINEA